MGDLFKQTSGMLWARGALGIIVGILAMAWPGITIGVYAWIWGIYALVDGVLLLGLAFTAKESTTGLRVWNGFVGVLALVAGFVALFHPFVSAVVLAWGLGIWVMAHGIADIFAAFTPEHADGRWWEVLAGVLWIIAGLLFVSAPFATAVTLAIWFGLLAIGWGIFSIVAGFRLRKVTKSQVQH